MVKFRLYKGGLDEVSMEFDNPEELKNNPNKEYCNALRGIGYGCYF